MNGMQFFTCDWSDEIFIVDVPIYRSAHEPAFTQSRTAKPLA